MTVFYEDSHIIVCLKPVGVQSENGTAALQGMPELLRAFWGDANALVFPVHRLDAAVSGMMVYAKTKQAAAALCTQMQDKRFEKEYRAVVCAHPTQSAQIDNTPPTAATDFKSNATDNAHAHARAPQTAAQPLAPCATLRDILYHDKRKGKVFPVKKERKGAKQAILHYEILETIPLPESLMPHSSATPCAQNTSAPRANSGCSAQATTATGTPPSPSSTVPICLVKVLLDTGRTHQIRVQFASRKHPLLGDGKYGSRIKLPSLALFSARLSFEHPKTHERLTFAAPLPSTAPWIFFDV